MSLRIVLLHMADQTKQLQSSSGRFFTVLNVIHLDEIGHSSFILNAECSGLRVSLG
jgi:hypothetical protein